MGLFIAKAISNIAHPIAILFAASYLLVLGSNHNGGFALRWAIASLMFAGIVAASILLGIKRGIFSDFDVSERKKRYLLYALVLSVSFFYLIFLFILSGPKILIFTTFAFIVAVFLMSVVNNWIKASFHLVTITAFFTTLIIVYGGTYVWGLLFISVVIWARIKTKRHTLSETLLGTFLGFFFAVAAYIIAKKILL